MNASPFQPIESEVNASHSSQDDPRLGRFVQSDPFLTLKDVWTLAGYPDDEGVCLGRGRKGAAQGPTAIRRWLYRMTPAVLESQNPVLIDRGDLEIDRTGLGDRHQAVRTEAGRTLALGGRWLGLGGGHDYGFPDGAAFLDCFGPQNPLVINFDAHFDVRPSHQGFSSGTPFFRLLEEFPKTEFLAIGIQSQCNARAHYQWLVEQGGKILFYDELLSSTRSAAALMCDFILPHLERPRPVFLSVDLDVFSSAFAPGCSQSWPTGLEPQDLLRVIDFLSQQRADVRVAGFYEVSPPLDLDDRTARLAALLIHRLIFNHTQES